MAFLELSFRSEVLSLNAALKVYLPGHSDTVNPGEPYKVLWVMHGGNADCNELAYQMPLFRIAEKYRYAVVLPGTCNSYGIDMDHGGRYGTFLEKELVPTVRRMLPHLSTRPEDNVAMGVSLGGFVAVRWALNCPQYFSKCGAFAGALAIPVIYDRYRKGIQPGSADFDYAFGSVERVSNNKNDILWLTKQRLAEGNMLPIYMVCGVDDFGFDLNDQIHKQLLQLGADLTFCPVPGVHDYECWEPHLEEFMDWIRRKERS